MITYEFLDQRLITDRNVDDINLLLPQLTTSPTPLTSGDIEAIAGNARLLVALDEKRSIKGMATLCVIIAPRGVKGIIEDVVVDAALCGRGIGTAFLIRLIAEARKFGAKKLELTSKPERMAANHLYQKLGFELRNTNHYRMNL